MPYARFIAEVLQEASQIARGSFGKVSGVTKAYDNNQVLTETDLAIGRAIIERIRGRKMSASHNIIDEEAGVMDNGSEYTWVIDPIDGTSNFANGSPLYGIILGLLKNGVPVAWGVALPAFSEICIAEKGRWAYCNEVRIRMSRETDLKKVLVAYGVDGHPENPELTREEFRAVAKLVLSIRNLRTSNSAFDAVAVAKGCYGAMLNKTSKVWDNVAQQILIEEAGGKYTDFYGNPLDYSRALTEPEANFTWLAAPAALHEKILKILSSETDSWPATRSRLSLRA